MWNGAVFTIKSVMLVPLFYDLLILRSSNLNFSTPLCANPYFWSILLMDHLGGGFHGRDAIGARVAVACRRRLHGQ